jgi:hypothetical protein
MEIFFPKFFLRENLAHMYPDLLSGELDEAGGPPQPPVSTRPAAYPSLIESSVDELEKFLDSDPEPLQDQVAVTSKYPPNIQAFSDGSYRCLWCEKTFYGEEQLEGHLQGKEHRKRCLNCDILPYGMPEHFREVEEYVSSYGHNLYARLKHWPVFIAETEYDWSCELCRKRFQTQTLVNQHLTEVDHTDREEPSPMERRYSSPLSPKVDRQERTPIPRTEELPGEKKSRQGSRVPSPIRAMAAEKERVARMSAMIDFDNLKCPICRMTFGTLKETEEHVETIRHIASYLEHGIKAKSYLI